MAEVELVDVSRTFPGGTEAVQSVNLTIFDKELLVLVGPSGCGKSTTLRMIAGLEEVTGGEIRIGSRRVNDLPPRDRDIAMVFQNYALYPHMNVRKNMSFGLEMRYGGSWLRRMWRAMATPSKARELAQMRSEIPQRVAAAAKSLEIDRLLERMPRQLSGGERQRVALGRAVVRQPACFLFDEPLSNLDAKLRVEMRQELKRLHRSLEATMLYVTHDQVEAMTLGQRIAVMHGGRLRQVGPPLEVYRRPNSRFVASFIGTPAMNLVTGELTERQGGLWFQAPGLQVAVPAEQAERLRSGIRGQQGQRVNLGVRAESIRLHEGTNRGAVKLVEPLGDAVLVHLQIGGRQRPQKAEQAEAARCNRSRLVVKAEAGSEIREGDHVGFVLDERQLHWFDAVSGARMD